MATSTAVVLAGGVNTGGHGMVKQIDPIYALILVLMQVKTGEGKPRDPSYTLTDNSGMGLREFCLHVFLLGLAFAFGFYFGKQRHTAQVQPRGQRAGVHASTGTYLTEIEVQIEDLTVEAIRERLRGLHCAVSGTKPELALRLQAAMHSFRARVVVAR